MDQRPYQSHKAETRAFASVERRSERQNQRSVSQQSLPDQKDGDILKQMGIEPPRYEELVVRRIIVPPAPSDHPGYMGVPRREELAGHEGPSNVDGIGNLPYGSRPVAHGVDVAPSSFLERRRARNLETQVDRDQEAAACETMWERRRAKKAARRAEKETRCGGRG